MKKAISLILALTFILGGFTANAKVKTIEKSGTATILVGERTHIKKIAERFIMTDRYSDYDGCNIEIYSATVTSAKYAAIISGGKTVKSTNKNSLLKGNKKGTASLTIKGNYKEVQEDRSTVTPFVLKLKLRVKSNSADNKTMAKLAKATVKKYSSKKKFAFTDLNYDGVKDLIAGGRVYIASPCREDPDEEGYFIPAKLIKVKFTKNFKVTSAYKCSLKSAIILNGTENKCKATTGKVKIVDKLTAIHPIDLQYPAYRLASPSKSFLKCYPKALYVEQKDEGEYHGFYDYNYITKTVYNNIKKQNFPKKTAIKFYKNTSKNRKKYIK